MRNMTEGRPLRLILQFALPLLLGNLFQQTYNIVDAAIVGRGLGTDALAAVGASSSVQFLVLGFCTGLCCGFGIPIAQAFGAGDHKALRDCVFHALVLTAASAVLLTAACALCCSRILRMLSTPANIFQDAFSYLFILFLGIPFTLLYNLLSSMLRAVGDSRTPFLFLVLATMLNIALDLLFIMKLNMGCAGAAAATIASQAVSGLLCAGYILKRLPLLWLKRSDMNFSFAAAGRMLWMGVPMGLQTSITAIGSMVMQSANNGLGSVYVSGFTAGMRIKQFALCPFEAIGIAVSTFCGQNLGGRKMDRIQAGVRDGTLLCAGYGLAAGLILIFCGRTLSMIFVSVSEASVLNASGQYLRSLGFFFWVLGILIPFRYAIQGIGFSGLAVFAGVTEMIARSSFSLAFVPMYGFRAICFTDQTAWISATIYLIFVCRWCLRRTARKLAAENP